MEERKRCLEKMLSNLEADEKIRVFKALVQAHFQISELSEISSKRICFCACLTYGRKSKWEAGCYAQEMLGRAVAYAFPETDFRVKVRLIKGRRNTYNIEFEEFGRN